MKDHRRRTIETTCQTNQERGTGANLTLGSDTGLAGTAEDNQSANTSCSAQMLLTGDSCYAPSCSCGAETAKAPLELPPRTRMRLKIKEGSHLQLLGVVRETHSQSTSLGEVFGRGRGEIMESDGAVAHAESLTLYAFHLSCENKQSSLLLYSTASQNLVCVYLILSGRHSAEGTHSHMHRERKDPDIWSI